MNSYNPDYDAMIDRQNRYDPKRKSNPYILRAHKMPKISRFDIATASDSKPKCMPDEGEDEMNIPKKIRGLDNLGKPKNFRRELFGLQKIYAEFLNNDPKSKNVSYETWLEANVFKLSELNLGLKERITELEAEVARLKLSGTGLLDFNSELSPDEIKEAERLASENADND